MKRCGSMLLFAVSLAYAILTTGTAFAQQGSRVIVNGDLEFGRPAATVSQLDTNFGFGATFDAGVAVMAPWFTTHPTQAGGCNSITEVGTCHPVEVWGNNFNPGNGAVAANTGSNFVELNAFTASTLYQNVCLQQNEQFAYSFAHRRRGQSGLATESVQFIFTDQSGTQIGSAVTTSDATGLQWFTRSGTATYGGTSGIQRLGFRATAPATGGAGNLLDSISITLPPLADLRGGTVATAAEGASLGTVFIRLNGTVAAGTTVAIQRTAPSTGAAAIDSDFSITGPSTVSHTAGTDIWLVSVPAGQYDGGIVAGTGAGNPADGITLTLTAATDATLEPQEGFRMQILAAGTNGSSTNWLSGDPVCGGDRVQQTDDFIITGQSEIRVAKISNGSTGAFTYALTNADTDLATAGNQTAASITTATAGTQTLYDANSGVAGIQGSAIVTPGSPVTITETIPATWDLTSASCVDASSNPVAGTSLAGGVLTVPGTATGATASLTCTFTNTRQADLSIQKTNTPGSGNSDQASDTVAGGSTTTYTLTVSNSGPGAVTGAVVRDTPTAGLTCPGGNAVSCSPAAACAGPYTVASLTGSSGITLGTLASGAIATLTFSCTVN